MKLKRIAIHVASKLTLYIHERWYLPLITLAAIVGIFVGFISMDFVLIISVLLQPSCWFKVAASLSIGSAVGSFVLGHLIQIHATELFDKVWELTPHGPWWVWATGLLSKHGILAFTLLTISPLPLTPLIIFAVSLGVAPLQIFLAVWIGRTIKYAIIGRIVFHIPEFFHKRMLHHHKK